MLQHIFLLRNPFQIVFSRDHNGELYEFYTASLQDVSIMSVLLNEHGQVDYQKIFVPYFVWRSGNLVFFVPAKST
jgi:hypothetical protein